MILVRQDDKDTLVDINFRQTDRGKKIPIILYWRAFTSARLEMKCVPDAVSSFNINSIVVEDVLTDISQRNF
jgi:hypothetical protein